MAIDRLPLSVRDGLEEVGQEAALHPRGEQAAERRAQVRVGVEAAPDEIQQIVRVAEGLEHVDARVELERRGCTA